MTISLNLLKDGFASDCIRGKVSYESGLHVFEIKWPTKQRGTHPVIGVSTGKGTFVNDVTQVRDGGTLFC